eukprot:m.669947 g.669947  ORF g.669947 m.669947 type:complete len:79 (+) comp22765_c0_seq18:3664-3900(+)
MLCSCDIVFVPPGNVLVHQQWDTAVVRWDNKTVERSDRPVAAEGTLAAVAVPQGQSYSPVHCSSGTMAVLPQVRLRWC